MIWGSYEASRAQRSTSAKINMCLALSHYVDFELASRRQARDLRLLQSAEGRLQLLPYWPEAGGATTGIFRSLHGLIVCWVDGKKSLYAPSLGQRVIQVFTSIWEHARLLAGTAIRLLTCHRGSHDSWFHRRVHIKPAYGVVRTHFETFLRSQSASGGIPRSPAIEESKFIRLRMAR